jgi:hypothetical protein
MPNQGWIDYLVVTPTHQGTTEARIDNLVVQPTHQGTTEARLDAITVQPTHQGTTEARLDALYVLAVWEAPPPTAVVPSFTGPVGIPTQFDGTGSLNTLSYVWTVLSIPGGSSTAFPAQALSDNGADGIISMAGNSHLYHCEDLPDDTSGSGTAVTLTGMTRQAVGILGDAWQATALNNRIQLSPSVSLGAGDYTIGFWFRDLGSDGRYRTGAVTTGGTTTYHIILDTSNALGVWFSSAFHGLDTGYTMAAASFTGWHHIAVVGSGSDMLFYVDGAYVGKVTGTKLTAVVGELGGDAFSDFWVDAGGRLDEAAIWQRALSAAEITAWYNGGAPTALVDFGGTGGPVSMTGNVLLLHMDGAGAVLTDTSGNAYTATLNAGITLAAAGQVGSYAVTLTGTQPLIQPSTAMDSSGGDFTFACWFFNLQPDTQYRTMVSSTSDLLLTEITTGNVGVWVSGAFRSSGFAMAAASYTGWHHIAWVGSGADTLVYVDGALVGTVTGYKPSSLLTSIGSNSGNPGQRFADRLDEIAFWTRALTAGEVKNLYNRTGGVASTLPFTPDVAGVYTVQLEASGMVAPLSTTTATATMSLATGPLLSCGFEANDLTFYEHMGWFFSGSGHALNSTRTHAPASGVGGQVSLFTNAQTIYLPAVSTSARWFHCWVDVDAWAASPYFNCTFLIGGLDQFTVQVTNTGNIVLRRGDWNWPVVATSAGTISAGPHWIVVELLAQNSGGVCNVYVDGTLELTYSGDTQRQATANWNQVRIFGSSAPAYVDDIIITDATDGQQAELYGYACPITGAGDTTGWTPTAGANWQIAQGYEVSPTDWNYPSALDQDDLYTVQHTRKVSSVGWVGIYAYSTSPGSVGVQTLARTGTSTGFSGLTVTGGAGDPAVVWTHHPLSPATGLAWTQDEIDVLQIGLRSKAT